MASKARSGSRDLDMSSTTKIVGLFCRELPFLIAITCDSAAHDVLHSTTSRYDAHAFVIDDENLVRVRIGYERRLCVSFLPPSLCLSSRRLSRLPKYLPNEIE